MNYAFTSLLLLDLFLPDSLLLCDRLLRLAAILLHVLLLLDGGQVAPLEILLLRLHHILLLTMEKKKTVF
jgi:hypothetical protein